MRPDGTCAWNGSSSPATEPAPSCHGIRPSAGGSSTRGYVERFGPEASTIGPPQEWDETHSQ